MDAEQALADLTEISSQIEAAVLFGEDGVIDGSTLADSGAAERLVQAARELLDAASELRSEGSATQIEAATQEGSVFVVREGEQRIVATTAAAPTVGLVFYDLKSCLRGVAAPEAPAPKRRRKTQQNGNGAPTGEA